jgi:hypothetical protein
MRCAYIASPQGLVSPSAWFTMAEFARCSPIEATENDLNSCEKALFNNPSSRLRTTPPSLAGRVEYTPLATEDDRLSHVMRKRMIFCARSADVALYWYQNAST